jgi:hypothetical protein
MQISYADRPLKKIKTTKLLTTCFKHPVSYPILIVLSSLFGSFLYPATIIQAIGSSFFPILQKISFSGPVLISAALIEPLPVQDGKDQAMIVDKSLISFVSGLSAENRADILESTLLAQFGAKNKIPDDTDVIGWYKAYIEILCKIGWTIEGGEVQHFSAKANVVELQTVIIDILKAAFGADFLQIVTKALDGIQSLADSNGKIEAFEKIRIRKLTEVSRSALQLRKEEPYQ